MNFRPLRRNKQALSEETCRDLLTKGRRGTLALHGDNGYAYAVPINYYYDEKKHGIYYHGALTGHKMDAIASDNRVSFNVISEPMKDEAHWYYEFDSATVFGKMKVIHDPEEERYALTKIAQKYFPKEKDIKAEVESSLGHAAILFLEIEHVSGKHVKES